MALSSNFPRTGMDEVRWCIVGPSRFVFFRIPNLVQPHQNRVGKRVLST